MSAPDVIRGATEIRRRHTALAQMLGELRPLWEPRPFVEPSPAWEAEHPDVSRALRALSLEQVEALEAAPQEWGDAPPAFRRWSESALAASRVGAHPAEPPPSLSRRELRHRVAGRKWSRIEAFVAAAPMPSGAPSGVDWCAGKGHLGRTLAAVHGIPVLAVERQVGLCCTGRSLAARGGLDCRFVAADVLSPAVSLPRGAACHALHACGALTDALLRAAVRDHARSVAVAPCCYHAAAAERVPSLCGADDVGVDRRLVRLAISDEVVARPRRRRARRRVMIYRLAFDVMLRERLGVERYVSLDMFPKRWFRLPFAPFAQRVAPLVGLELGAGFEPDACLARARERLRVARALALVRALFRRPLELWWVLDRARYLSDAGFDVSVGTFCSRALSPRNLLILASRQRGDRVSTAGEGD